MVELSASISEGDVARFNSALSAFSMALGREAQTAPRRAAIQLCKSFRAGTRTAPKYARGSEYTATKSDADPKHKRLTLKDGRVLRRFHLDRPPRGTEYDLYAENKSDIRRTRLLLARRGLAKKSWGWVMHNIFNGAAPDEPWQRRKNDRRDPKDATRESTSRSSGGTNTYSGYARICNRLDYAADALKISIDAATQKAATWMEKQVERKLAWKGKKR